MFLRTVAQAHAPCIKVGVRGVAADMPVPYSSHSLTCAACRRAYHALPSTRVGAGLRHPHPERGAGPVQQCRLAAGACAGAGQHGLGAVEPGAGGEGWGGLVSTVSERLSQGGDISGSVEWGGGQGTRVSGSCCLKTEPGRVERGRLHGSPCAAPSGLPPQSYSLVAYSLSLSSSPGPAWKQRGSGDDGGRPNNGRSWDRDQRGRRRWWCLPSASAVRGRGEGRVGAVARRVHPQCRRGRL